uniref:Uncharacterized protein n=1 Tax=Cyprinus carpio TaxID=7962 RepID=A0A8C2K838_CYPCA
KANASNENVCLIKDVKPGLKTITWLSSSWKLVTLFLICRGDNNHHFFCIYRRFCMIFSEVPNFSDPNPEVLAKINQINNTHIKTEAHGSTSMNPGPPAGSTAIGSAVFSPCPDPREISFGSGGHHLNRRHWNSGSASPVPGGGHGSKPTITISKGRDPRRALKR